jgi:hypothetical protein
MHVEEMWPQRVTIKGAPGRIPSHYMIRAKYNDQDDQKTGDNKFSALGI